MSSKETSSNKPEGYQPDASEEEILDPEFYVIPEEDKRFFKEYVGFKDDDEFKAHAFEIRKKAYAVSFTPDMMSSKEKHAIEYLFQGCSVPMYSRIWVYSVRAPVDIVQQDNQIHRYVFGRFSVRKFPEYPKILSLPKERKDAIFLDIGTGCMIKAFASDALIDILAFMIFSRTWAEKTSVWRISSE